MTMPRPKVTPEIASVDECGLLRLITCGSVDDGKSTLIGRLLVETGNVYADHLKALEKENRLPDGAVDVSLLVDGLQAERDQGITIDVAYRYFSSARRRFIVADTPGHEQYTRNMATAASNAELAVLLVDARAGLLRQTLRHASIVSLFGVRSILLAVNKMDLVDYDESVFRGICETFLAQAVRMGVTSVTALPVSAVRGDMIVRRGDEMPWYRGPTLLEALEQAETSADAAAAQPFRMAVQGILRGAAGERWATGMIASGTVSVGDEAVIQPSARRAHVDRLWVGGVEASQAAAGQSVAVMLDRPVDVTRGDVLASPDSPAVVSDLVTAHVVWLSVNALREGQRYLIQLGTQTTGCVVRNVAYRVDLDGLENVAADALAFNEIGKVDLGFDRVLACDAYAACRDMGGFILIDRLSNDTVAAGVIDCAAPSERNVHWQDLLVNQDARARLKGQKPCVLWFTGLSASGKSTVANLVEKSLHAAGHHTYMLDGDNIRHGLSGDLGFSPADRVENIRRVAEVAKLFVDAGLIVIVSLVSPYVSERQMARSRVGADEFIEIFMDTPLDVCEARDPKGLYRKARRGALRHFTGIDSPYEKPLAPELSLDTVRHAPEDLAGMVVDALRLRGRI